MNYKYSYSDTHCDTLTELFKSAKSLNNNEYMVNLSHLKKYNGATQVFAIYNIGKYLKKDIIDIASYLKNECIVYSDFISLETKSEEILKNSAQGKISALLSIENLGSQVDLSLQDIEYYKQNGIIIMGLCHNDDNSLCGGIENTKGLTTFGRKILRQMQKQKIILDVSHMGEKSYWEALEEYSIPFMASHSNSRSVCNHPRNITDSQFAYLVKRGGLCGINFVPSFLNGEKSDINSVISHIEHFMSLGGENSLCIGSDFDGIEKCALGLENAACVYRLFDKLLAINYNESLINKIAFSNFHNFLKKYETLI